MKRLLLVIIAASVFFNSNAQISAGGVPESFSRPGISTAFMVKTMPALDIPAIIAEEEARGDEPRPYKFGQHIPVHYTLNNSGTWEQLKKGRLWRLAITSEGAFTLNFIFNHFYLPAGAKLFIYNPEKDYILGAFTNANNQSDRLFSTDILKGETAILEYYEPNEVLGQGIIELGTVSHGYKNLFQILGEFSTAGSGSCNNDINCPGWEDWQDDKRSVGVMMTNSNIGSAFCTGTMVVDVPQSGTPYFLTANHCMGGNTSTWVFRFNWEHTTCNQSATPTAQTLTGATQRSTWATSDFALLELTTTPPANYNVYYAGWTNDGVAATQATGIHHPSGDVKKISRDESDLTSTGWGGPGTSHWNVPSWDDGVTEPGSSGSGLWDQNHRLVGQLHGGASACGNPANQMNDQYGKFSVSWTGNNTNATRLSNWLDPQGTGTTAMDGWDPNAPTVAYDAKINAITSPAEDESYCSGDVTPVVVIKNVGTTTLTAIDINYNFDGGTSAVYNWTGSLATNATASVTLPQATLASGTHTFNASTTIVGNADENTSNDALSSTFAIVANGNTLSLTVTSDGYGEENTWELEDANGTVIFTGGPFGNDETTTTEICVAGTGCYTFTMLDSYGDGMCCTQGNGSFLLEDENGFELASGGSFTSSDATNFCLPISSEPPNSGFASNNQQVCEGMIVTYTNQTVSGLQATYAWVFQGGSPATSTATNPTVTYTNQGTYDVRLIATNQFGSDTTLLVDYITVIDAPEITTTSTVDHIGSPNDGTATVQVFGGASPYTYVWSNGQSTANSTNSTNTITGLAAGNYNVQVTDGNGCVVSESILVSTNTGLEEQSIEALVSVYPNPAKDMITVELPAGKTADMCDLFNVIGSRIESFTVAGKQKFTVDLKTFAKGVYFLRMNVDGQLITKKIIITK
ncbi:MAG: T9SS type A sorting domain-containing protein [Bacteroidia bacterium]